MTKTREAVRISVVIPTWNRPQLLARALASALAQDFAAMEVIVVDDGDGYGATLAVGLGEARVRTLATTAATGRGQVAARNLGVAAAAGRWIAFLDDDDWWAEKDYLSCTTDVLAAGDGLAFASGRVVTEEGAVAVEELEFASTATPESLSHDNTLLVSGVAFPRAALQVLGPFDGSLPHYWDWDWYLRLVAAGVPLRPVPSTAVRISARTGTVSDDTNAMTRAAELERLRHKHGLPPLVLRNHLSIARDAVKG
jgi:glycosyltransferase involved in cell wall biosynthesis